MKAERLVRPLSLAGAARYGARMGSWFESLFDDRYLRFYPELLDLGQPEREAAFVDRALSVPQGTRLLDLGCGFGRHAVPLSLLGYSVTGLDLSPSMLRAARKLSDERGAQLEWLARDMRSLEGLGPFGACTCLYTVFGYFDDAENEGVLRSIASVLLPDGPFLLDVSNPLAFASHLPTETWREGSFGVRCERSRYDALSGRVITDRILLGADGRRETLPTSSVRMYTPSELRVLLERSGFEVEALYGALADEPYVAGRSSKMVLLARRR